MGQENGHRPKKNPLREGEHKKHAPHQGPDVGPAKPASHVPVRAPEPVRVPGRA